jgi:hypothetical protein
MPNVVLKGPVFASNMPDKLNEGVMDGLKELGTQVVADVHSQLYGNRDSRHGWITGRLKGSIGLKMLPGPGFVVESGATSGAAVPYAYWIETGKRRGRRLFSGYQMFANADRRLHRGGGKHINDVLLKYITKKLGGRGLI